MITKKTPFFHRVGYLIGTAVLAAIPSLFTIGVTGGHNRQLCLYVLRFHNIGDWAERSVMCDHPSIDHFQASPLWIWVFWMVVVGFLWNRFGYRFPDPD